MKHSAYTRKIILLSSIAFLLAVYIFQLAFLGKTKIKTVVFDGDIDAVEITKNGFHILSLKKENENWLADDLPAMENRVNRIVNSINEIKILSTVSYDFSDLERYGLTDENAVKVVAFSGGKEVRTLYAGKDSAAGSQCYVRVDDDKKIYLVQGTLKSTFEVSAEDLKIQPAPENSPGAEEDSE
ncbi:DUF4340 domain-containing protein [Treponema sp.]|uniref:DUF4340 domain-containing protein n=1 Tax=Treponema sp. TaxID=166 RepID=UPI003F07ECDA